MTRVTGSSRIWLVAVVLSVGVGVAVIASIISFSGDSGGNDTKTSSIDASGRKSVKVIIAGTNDAKEEVTDGGIAGEGTFIARGAITDRGTVRAYRGLSVLNEGVIVLRFVSKGRKGAITYIVRIDTTRRPVISRWTIESGTRAYKGLRGKGIETENATYTVSTLRGKMWR